MSAYGREWQKHRDRIEALRVEVEAVTGRKDMEYAELRQHIDVLQKLLLRYARMEHDIANIKESDNE